MLFRHGNAMRILYLANHDDTVKASYAIDVAQGVEHEVLISLHVARVDLYQKIIVASGIIALRHLVYGLHDVHELLYQVVGMLFQAYIAKHNDMVTKLVMVNHGRIALDVAFTLQTLLSLECGRR